jgi:hypothetical protein
MLAIAMVTGVPAEAAVAVRVVALDEPVAPVTVQLVKLPDLVESPRMLEGCSSLTLRRNPSAGSTVVAVTGVFAADINSRLSNGSIARAMAADVVADLLLRFDIPDPNTRSLQKTPRPPAAMLLRFDFPDPNTSMSPPFQNKWQAHWKPVA